MYSCMNYASLKLGSVGDSNTFRMLVNLAKVIKNYVEFAAYLGPMQDTPLHEIFKFLFKERLADFKQLE